MIYDNSNCWSGSRAGFGYSGDHQNAKDESRRHTINQSGHYRCRPAKDSSLAPRFSRSVDCIEGGVGERPSRTIETVTGIAQKLESNRSYHGGIIPFAVDRDRTEAEKINENRQSNGSIWKLRTCGRNHRTDHSGRGYGGGCGDKRGRFDNCQQTSEKAIESAGAYWSSATGTSGTKRKPRSNRGSAGKFIAIAGLTSLPIDGRYSAAKCGVVGSLGSGDSWSHLFRHKETVNGY